MPRKPKLDVSGNVQIGARYRTDTFDQAMTGGLWKVVRKMAHMPGRKSVENDGWNLGIHSRVGHFQLSESSCQPMDQHQENGADAVDQLKIA